MDLDADRRTRSAAWAASLAAHTLLTAGVVYFGVQGGVEAGGDAVEREVGVVLRESSQPPAPLESDSTTDSETTEPTPPIDAAPSDVALAPSPFSDLLTDLLGKQPEGAGPPVSAGGAPPPPPAGGGARPKLPLNQTEVSFYGVTGVGSRFVFALDRSTSMTGGPIRSAKAELLQSLQAIEETHRFHILFFNTRVKPLDLSGGKNRLAYGTDENKRRAARFVGSITAQGGTERKLALDTALRQRPDVIFFLTDDDSPMTPGEMAEVLADAIGAVTIHAVEFGKGPDHGRRNFLVELAERTGGSRCYVDTTRLPR